MNDILKACKTWFNYLVEEDYIEARRNPAAKVKYLKQPKTIIETFSTQEVKELIHYYSGCDYLEVRNKTIITLLFDTGMRCNEMIMMEPEDIGWFQKLEYSSMICQFRTNVENTMMRRILLI